MADSTVKLIKDAEKAMVKLRNKLKRVDLNYTIQVSVNSTQPTKLSYAAQMSPPAEGLAPVTFIADSGEELIAKIKEATKHINYGEVEKAYHKAQIEACKRTIEIHEDRLKGIDEEEGATEEGTDAPEDKTSVQADGEVTRPDVPEAEVVEDTDKAK